MLYVKKVIAMLRSVLHDISIKICTGCTKNSNADVLDVFTRISNSLDRLESDFRLFFEYYKEHNDNE